MKKPLLHRSLSLTGDSRIQMLGAASFSPAWPWGSGRGMPASPERIAHVVRGNTGVPASPSLSALLRHRAAARASLPASPLLILSGIVFGPDFGMPVACAITILSLILDMSWTYAVAAGPARAMVERLLTGSKSMSPNSPPEGRSRSFSSCGSPRDTPFPAKSGARILAVPFLFTCRCPPH